MVNNNNKQLDTVFSALSDTTRRKILARLARGDAQVSELAKPFNISLPAVSKHLKILEEAGLMTRKKDGRNHHCFLNTEPLKNAVDWLNHYRVFWEGQLDSLEKFITQIEKEKKK